MLKKILILCLLLPCLAQAKKPIVLVVPFGAGGPADQVAKVVQKTLSQELDQPVVLDYKPGAGGDIANAYVANWTREETVLLLQSSALASNQALNNSSYNKSALTPLVYLGSMPLVLVVPKRSNLVDFKSWQNLNPQTPVTWGSAGIGSSSHIYGEVFRHKIQKNLVHVPYKGIAQIMPDLIAGTIDSAFVFASTAEPFVQAQRIVPVAVAADKRLKNLPTVPTFKELGLKNMDYYSWFVLLTNYTVPPAEQQKIQQSMIKILSNPEMIKQFQQVGLEVNPSTITQAFVAKEVHRYQEIIRVINLKQDN